MDLLLSMSLAGSMSLLIYFLIRPVILLRFSSTWRYRFLKITLLFFLLPYQYIKPEITELVRRFASLISPPNFSDNPLRVSVNVNRAVFIYPDGSTYIKNGELLSILYTIWGVVISAMAFYHLHKYIQCKKLLHKISTPPSSIRLYTDYKRAKKRKRKVQLLSSSYISVPFTIGFFSPLIVLPDTLTEKNKRKMVLSHELTHIINRDALIKLLCLAVICLHWYNPLAYLLYYEITKTIEHVCDETVTKDMTLEEKTAYQLMLLEMKDQETTEKLFVTSFSGNFRVLKERILVMNKTLSSKNLIRLTSFITAALLCVFGVLSILTYSPITELHVDPESDFQILSFEGDMFICDLPFEEANVSSLFSDASPEAEEILTHTSWDCNEVTAFCLEEAAFITGRKALSKAPLTKLRKPH